MSRCAGTWKRLAHVILIRNSRFEYHPEGKKGLTLCIKVINRLNYRKQRLPMY
jgi:hypothetical protein